MKHTILLLCALLIGCSTLSAMDNQKNQPTNLDAYRITTETPYQTAFVSFNVGPEQRKYLKARTREQVIEHIERSLYVAHVALNISPNPKGIKSLTELAQSYASAALELFSYAETIGYDLPEEMVAGKINSKL